MDEADRLLLNTCMNLHYRDRTEIINKSKYLVQEYIKGKRTNYQYDKLLKALHHLMDDLPPTILLYHLTTIPFPIVVEKKVPSTFLKLMKKSREFLAGSINMVLKEYLNNSVPPLLAFKDFNSISESQSIKLENLNNSVPPLLAFKDFNSISESQSIKLENETSERTMQVFEAPAFKSNQTQSTSCRTLLEISAEYVISNLQNLFQAYVAKNDLVWKKINNNEYVKGDKRVYYQLVNDINTKLNWLRLIDSGYVPADVLRDHFGESCLFLQKSKSINIKHSSNSRNAKKLKKAIRMYVGN